MWTCVCVLTYTEGYVHMFLLWNSINYHCLCIIDWYILRVCACMCVYMHAMHECVCVCVIDIANYVQWNLITIVV